MMKIDIELDETELKRLVFNQLDEMMPESDLKMSDIKILVKSKQNYKAEWEEADFKATVIKTRN